jgi:GNAT superfamily N-acetyltransferase
MRALAVGGQGKAMMTTIRSARGTDASAIAALSGELGYPATSEEIGARLIAIDGTHTACVLVAERAQGVVVGWVHVARAAHLTHDAEAEILGLIVAAVSRGAGIGAELLRIAEQWARSQGAARLGVRSRLERERAHRFYERAGYRRLKTQAVFVKPLLD